MGRLASKAETELAAAESRALAEADNALAACAGRDDALAMLAAEAARVQGLVEAARGIVEALEEYVLDSARGVPPERGARMIADAVVLLKRALDAFTGTNTGDGK